MTKYIDPLSDMLDFQTWRGKAPPEQDTDDGEVQVQQGWPDPIVPRRAMWELKHMYPDYQHGPVKVYTKEEIDEYNKSRSLAS